MIGKAIYDRLTTDESLSELIGTRVYPELSPEQDTYPVIVYSVEDADRDAARSYDSSTLVFYHVTVVCIARTYQETIDLSELVITSLDNESGTWGDITVQGAFLESASEDLITIADAQEARFNMRELGFLIVAEA